MGTSVFQSGRCVESPVYREDLALRANSRSSDLEREGLPSAKTPYRSLHVLRRWRARASSASRSNRSSDSGRSKSSDHLCSDSNSAKRRRASLSCSSCGRAATRSNAFWRRPVISFTPSCDSTFLRIHRCRLKVPQTLYNRPVYLRGRVLRWGASQNWGGAQLRGCSSDGDEGAGEITRKKLTREGNKNFLKINKDSWMFSIATTSPGVGRRRIGLGKLPQLVPVSGWLPGLDDGGFQGESLFPSFGEGHREHH